MIKRALISVSDKSGIIDLAKVLAEKNVEILSTGGTAKLMRDNGIEVKDVSDYTGFPEMMNGRVKTLHPKVHGGLLAVRSNAEHMKAAADNHIEMIDLVVVNLYPFEATIQKEGVTEPEAIEQIDIGGPSMLRSAAKNFQSVTVLTDPADYAVVTAEIQSAGDTTPETRRRLAEKVFQTTAKYDAMIAEYLSHGITKHIVLEKIQDLRYGENPHQSASVYKRGNPTQACIPNAEVLQGKPLSYNNIMDADGALAVVREFSEPAVVFIKHANPCGTATASTIEAAYQNAYAGDPKSAFGGIIALNRPCTQAIAEHLVSQFFEIVLAPDFEPEALKTLEQKPNMRVLKLGEIQPDPAQESVRPISGGMLVQDLDIKQLSAADLKVVTEKAPTPEQMNDLKFAWHVVKHVKSNAIVFAKDGMTVGVGAGQMSRVDAVEIAIKKADGREKGSVLASDAFFPFADSIDAAAEAGVTAIIQPGGSVRDDEVIAACNQKGIAMVFTGTRLSSLKITIMEKSLFEKIADREIPSFTIWEDDRFMAFLTIGPMAEGHTLVIPKKNWGTELFELSDSEYTDLLTASKTVARLLKQKTACDRVLMQVEGFEVPHVHVHLIPANQGFSLAGAQPKSPSMDELSKVHQWLIRTN
ncbi:bifunctional phosphoribosylaminoimidazolecarboxamide formyltransferase/IMP cyclohydrolase [Candidatus Peregrinibacteria bacterium]|nr:MAG: bifunctional phosphoribosylaminoimidazolecarboxamide formyltransferase/IMP cyclohydrolase [Candidatus Peregrinibacteria bacterium]